MENNQVLATVANREITENHVNFVKKNLDPQTAMQFNSPEGQKRIVHELVNQELLFLDALDNNIEQDSEFKAQFERIKSDFIKQFYMNKLLGSIDVEDKDILEFYGLNRDMFVEGESVKASHILVDTEEKALIILDEINDGLSFEEAAKEYSNCPSREAGGDLGYFTRGKMVPEFEEASFEMEPGEISIPVKTQFGYHLIKVVDHKEPKILSYDEVKENIRKHLLSERQQEVYFGKVAELKKKYPVRINV